MMHDATDTDPLPQGNAYVRDGNLAQAYLLLFRFSTLVLEHIPRHPEAKTPEGKRSLKGLKERVILVLGVLDDLKPQLNDAHAEWVKIHAAQRDASTELQGEKSPYEKMAARDAALSWNPQVRAKLLDASDNQDLAVDLAKQEIRRRDAARKATRQAGISEEVEQERRAAGLWEDWDVPAPRDRRHDDGDDIRHNMDAVRRRLDQTEQARRRPPSSDGQTTRPNNNYNFYNQTPSYQYPSISRSSSQQHDNAWSGDTYDSRPLFPPALPPKPRIVAVSSPADLRPPPAPPRPNKEPIISDYGSPPPTESTIAPQRPPKMAKVDDKKERFTFRPAAYLENGTPIRPIFLPAGMREEFLRVAAPNTRQGLEMCGILCGTSVNNALFISCLVIPQQTCTSDTCETDNEEAVMEFCMREDLMVFGWIHTHPTQTCFMSSRDLHTQSGYQVMMPESIAIVCAPSSEPS